VTILNCPRKISKKKHLASPGREPGIQNSYRQEGLKTEQFRRFGELQPREFRVFA
jgi:hypothetical protein